jgi:hypothetical protein
MSNIGWYKSRIKLAGTKEFPSNIEANPLFQILERSLEIVAQKQHGKIVDQVTDFGGRKTACDLAVVTDSFPRGVGIKVDRDTGTVTFLYDRYGSNEQVVQSIVEGITQNYVAIALIRSMKSLGYRVEEETNEERDTVVLVGKI